MAGPWEIRRASLADRDDLVQLCTAAVGPDDYVIEIVEDLTLHGVWHIALDGDRVVGAMHYTETVDGSAWLAAARTHPEYRRRGVARVLLESFAGLARRSRVPAIRLWSSARNLAGNAAARSAGMQEVARFTRVKRKVHAGPARAEPVAFDPGLSEAVAASRLLKLANGYVPFDWYFLALTPANVHLLANRGSLHRVPGGIVVLSVHPEVRYERALDFGLVSGVASRVLRGMPAVGKSQGFEEAHAFLPHDPAVLAAAERAGFGKESWGQEAVLFERRIELDPASYRKRPTYAEINARKRGGYAALALLAGHPGGHGHTGPHEDRWNP